jgi:hypothetical protein
VVRAAASLSALALVAACSSAELVPVTPSGSGRAVVQSDGVSVEVDGDAGGSPVYLPMYVEPVRIAIHNGSDRGIHVSLDAIELTRNDVVSLSPVAPKDIEPRPYVRGTGLDPASPFAQTGPGSVGIDVRLATEYPAVYRGLTMGDTGIDVRRAEIIDKAFTDGYIEAGQTREGFVYFENVPTNADRLNLVIPVHTGQGSGTMTTLTVPLEVKG